MIILELPGAAAEPVIVPHPELAAAQRPGPADVARAAGLLGWLPEPEDRFRPAVPVE